MLVATVLQYRRDITNGLCIYHARYVAQVDQSSSGQWLIEGDAHIALVYHIEREINGLVEAAHDAYHGDR